jgi:hypothetical protein
LVRVGDVLAEVAGVNPSRQFDEAAELAAKGLPAKLVERDWSGRPCIPAVDAERLLLRLRRDQAERDRVRAEQMVAAEDEYAARMPPGVVGVDVPGFQWSAPGVDPRVLRGAQPTNVPGAPR